MDQPASKEIVKEFPTQRLDEKPIVVMRRHWVSLVKFWLEGLAFSLLPLVIIGVLYGFEILAFEPAGALWASMILGASLYYVFIARHILHHWVDYYLDVWAITDQRIVSIELSGLFNRTISELPIEKVQDVTSEIRGPLATFLDYGNVYIQTAGEKERFVFEQIAHPQKIQAAVLRVHDQYIAKEQERSQKELAEEIGKATGQGPATPAAPATPTSPAAPAAPAAPATPPPANTKPPQQPAS